MATTKAYTYKSLIGRALREAGASLRQAGKAEIFSRHRTKMYFNGFMPFQTNDSYFAPTANVIGDVTAWDQSSIWYKAVVRADNPNSEIVIGFCSSIGEGSVVMTDLPSVDMLPDTGFPPDTHVGHFVVVGSGCVLKSCRIDDFVLIGDKCTILPGALVESKVILEPGTVVEHGQRIPSGQKWGGHPAKFIAELTPFENEGIKGKAEQLHVLAKEHLTEMLPVGHSFVHMEDLEKELGQKPTSG